MRAIMLHKMHSSAPNLKYNIILKIQIVIYNITTIIFIDNKFLYYNCPCQRILDNISCFENDLRQSH